MKKIYIAEGFGSNNRVVYSKDGGKTVNIGSFKGTLKQAKEVIIDQKYLPVIEKCLNGTNNIDYWKNHEDYSVRRLVKSLGF